MSTAADLILTNGEVHTLSQSSDAAVEGEDAAAETFEAVAIRDGRVVRLTNAYDVEMLAGTETRVVDLSGRVVLPGFVDAHTHLSMVGRRLVHADCSVDSRAGVIDRLRTRASDVDSGWVQGFGYDESRWADDGYLTRADLDEVSTSNPVVAFREDMHVASVNSVALDRLGLDAGDYDGDVQGTDEATGVLVEHAVDAVWEAVAPTKAETRTLLAAAQADAVSRGVTAVHDMVRQSHAPAVYRDLEREGALDIRVRLNYWSDHLDSLRDVGLVTNHGDGLVTVGAIKTYTDGSFGGRTAKLSDPYADAETTGQWVVPPEELDSIVTEATDAGFQVTAHAIGDAAVDAVLDAFEGVSADPADRHRIEHAELTSDDAIERMAEMGVVASVQPNFLKWADEGGLYDRRLGERGSETNRYRAMLDAGVDVAFGSDCMPLDPLLGVHHAVTHPAADQRLSVTEALRAYTVGGAYAGFDENDCGALSVGSCADLVVLDESPWTAEKIDDVDPVLTVTDGRVVYDALTGDSTD